jgi:hypothetical protein
MRTEEAVSGADGIVFGYAALALVYGALIVATLWVLRKLARTPLPPEIAALEPGFGADAGAVSGDGSKEGGRSGTV